MELNAKLLTIQQKVKSTKDKKNTFGNYTYRSAEGIIEDIKPILGETKTFITLSDSIAAVADRIYVVAKATLHDAESDKEISVLAYAREAESKKGMDEAQITGAASSYARKYALSGLLLLDDNKDADSDEYTKQTQEKGNSAPKKATPAPKAQPKQTIRIVCADCGNEITEYQGQPAAKIAQATAKKYGKPICMNCSAKRRATPPPPPAPVAPAEEIELPFEIEG